MQLKVNMSKHFKWRAKLNFIGVGFWGNLLNCMEPTAMNWYLQLLPWHIGIKAVRNATKAGNINKRYLHLHDAITKGFDINSTPEGAEYWLFVLKGIKL